MPDTAIDLLKEMKRLMELKGENPFKVRAFEKASRSLAGRSDLMKRAKEETLTELEGVGKGIAEVLAEFLLHGRSTIRDELLASIPSGLIELSEVPGLGPKKARVLIEDLGIHSLGELEYACRENRLLKLKGFGAKLQQKILEGILFQMSNEGQQRLGDILTQAEVIQKTLSSELGGLRISETGALRRRAEVLSQLEFLVELPENGSASTRGDLHSKIQGLKQESGCHLPLVVHWSPGAAFGYELARTTGTPAHWEALGAPAAFEAASEEEFFHALGLPLIPPEARETGEEVRLARSGKLNSLLPWNGIRGVFHNHTISSDGAATLEQMVIAAKRLGYEYIGISDHSQSAFYAHGLKSDLLLRQEEEVREVQEKHPEIRVFWGIESDILQDGALDYDDATLARFDFVVASVHSRFKMDRDAMTDRVLRAVRNPRTRILGHPTGRLLLGRPAYEMDMLKVIDEAARCGVAVEINANPQRLDIDWRWGPELRKSGTSVSINPDAHDVDGLKDTYYGIAMARKALLPKQSVINSKAAAEVEKWLRRA